MQRRTLLLGTLPSLTAGCAVPPPGGDARATGRPTRRFGGGFLAPSLPVPGRLPRPGSGMYVKLQAPGALALRGFDLLVADAASATLWRVDLMTQTLSGVAGAPVGPDAALWLGPDRSAWVMDPAMRQVLRFALDGRLLQTWRAGSGARGAFAVLDGGATLAVADAAWGRWSELRSGGALALTVTPRRADGTPLAGVDALAGGREHLFVLDRANGAVHRMRRDGQWVDTLARGLPGLPSMLAVDRFDRAWVLDGSGRSVTLLAAGQAPLVRSAADLGVQWIGGLAVDDHSLAVSDRVVGEVVIHPLPAGVPP